MFNTQHGQKVNSDKALKMGQKLQIGELYTGTIPKKNVYPAVNFILHHEGAGIGVTS